MKKRWMGVLMAGVALAFVAGCGKPQAGGGPPPGMAMPAIVGKVKQEEISISVDLVASLVARDQVTLVSELDSTVLNVAVKEGDRVKKGDVLFTLDDVQTKARLEEAKSALSLAELSFKRNKELLANETISQQEYDEAVSMLASRKAGFTLAKDQQAKTTIRAPFAGVVGEKSVSAGQYVRRGDVLIALTATDPLDLVVDVPERYLSSVKAGQVMRFETDAFQGESFEGVVRYIAPTLSEASRTVRVKAEVANKDMVLRPGLFGRVVLELENRDALMLPETAISVSRMGATVVTVSPEGMTGFAPVTTGIRQKGRVEIAGGLDAGVMVVLEGWQKMGPGMPVIAAPGSEAHGVAPGPIGAPAAEGAAEEHEPEATDESDDGADEPVVSEANDGVN